ncbi:MAG: inositol monophosphatase family protein [Rickettsiales bacterium]
MASPVINVMTSAAIKAGKGLLRDFGEVDKLQISRKGASNFVTKSDIRTEKLLRKELSVARPDYGFLMEEEGEIEGKDKKHRWIIDPLDGTSNFIHAIPYFCISIALEELKNNGKREITAGVIFDPIHNELFSAEKGKGALLNNRKILIASRSNFEELMLATGSPRDAIAACERMEKCGSIIRHFGASALDLANMAAGRIDACWHNNVQPWDIAAGMLIVTEAGGVCRKIDGADIDIYSNSILASSPFLFDSVKKIASDKS